MEEKYGNSGPMKCRFTSAKIRSLWSVLFALAFHALVCECQAAANPYTWTSGSTTMTVDYLTGGGLTSWLVGGNNQVDKQWFYYRTGGAPGAVSPINNISASPLVQTPAGRLQVTYTNTAGTPFTVRALFAPGGTSGGNETITIVNLSTTSSLSIDLFQYSHFTLNDTSGSENVSIQTGGADNSAWQTNSSGGYLNDAASALPAAPHFAEASVGNLTMSSMLSPTFTHLNNNLSASGDVTFAYEWDFNIAPGGSEVISIIQQVVVPEPSALTLIGLGLVSFALRRRSQSCFKAFWKS